MEEYLSNAERKICQSGILSPLKSEGKNKAFFLDKNWDKSLLVDKYYKKY